MIHIRYRRQILFAALSPYHRFLDGQSVHRQLRQWPWWTARETEEFRHGRVFAQRPDVVLVTDEQLRTIARKGVHMAFTGEADVNDVRVWGASLVADQARCPHSLLEETEASESLGGAFAGYEGTLLRRSVRDIKDKWTEDEWERLATVMDGVRHRGLEHLFKTRWVVAENLRG